MGVWKPIIGDNCDVKKGVSIWDSDDWFEQIRFFESGNIVIAIFDEIP